MLIKKPACGTRIRIKAHAPNVNSQHESSATKEHREEFKRKNAGNFRFRDVSGAAMQLQLATEILQVIKGGNEAIYSLVTAIQGVIAAEIARPQQLLDLLINKTITTQFAIEILCLPT